jgi:hypothetical protein
MPTNIGELLESPQWASLVAMIVALGYPWIGGEGSIYIGTPNESLRLFFAGYANRVLRPLPEDTAHFNFSGSKPKEAGRAAADAEVFIQLVKFPGNFTYLPDSVKGPKGKGKMLTGWFSQLGGPSGIKSIGDLPQRVAEITSRIAKASSIYQTMATGFKIPYGSVVANLARTKTRNVKENGLTVQVSVNIHPSKPTTIVEALLESDKVYLGRLEAPWHTMNELAKENSKGVSPANLEAVQQAYKRAYDEQFKNLDKLSTIRARRREAISSVLKGLYPRKTPEYTPRVRAEVLYEIGGKLIGKPDVKDISQYDAFNLLTLTSAVGGEVPGWADLTCGKFITNKTGLWEKTASRITRESLDSALLYVGQFGNPELDELLYQFTEDGVHAEIDEQNDGVPSPNRRW